ncbi:MAG: hypothetical protein FJW88_13245 [Actinobacteria bacterium]|nr:hypothetical protein [Actinomycetota bacterium]
MTVDGFEALDRVSLARLGREWMLFGHLYDRALMPQVALRLGMDEITRVAIAEWQGASPNYTRRMRRLMGIDGDGASAICKALQLDVGFPHEYMDVGYRIRDENHAEFWLKHCGALIDVEPQGEQMVVNMCVHIEDPTFDATAVATNPRAQIRPIHRPPRTPADRVPHCHWTLTIDPQNPPVVQDPLTTQVGELDLTAVSNQRPPDAEPGGLTDYSGPFDPDFRLEDLSHGALVAALREFAIQCQLLSAAAGLFLRECHDPALVAEVQAAQWEGACWVAAGRIATLLDVAGDLDGILTVLACHPGLPPGIDRSVTRVDERHATVVFAGDLLDPDAPGWLGLLATGEPSAVRAIAQAVEPRAHVSADRVARGHVAFMIDVDPDRAPVEEPPTVALTRLSTAADWTFRT